MENKQNLERKTLVVGQYDADCSHLLKKYYLPRLNCVITHHNHGFPAAQAIK